MLGLRSLMLVAATAVAVSPFIAATDAQAAACTNANVSLTIGATVYNASSCADNVANGNPAQETTNLNAAFGGVTLVLLDSTSQGSPSTGFGGITVDVSATGTKVAGDSKGTWTVTWSEAAGLPNLPVIVDFAVYIAGGSTGDAYLLSNVTLPVSPTTGSGTFDIVFLNNGGNEPDLSHFTLAGRIVGTPTNVPEPMTLSLLGMGLIGLGAVARRRRS